MSQTQPIQRVAVIMAGGSGDRFWPLSRHNRPKQLLRLTNQRLCLLEEAVQRITPLIGFDHVYIVTSAHLVNPIRCAAVGVPEANVIGEPARRNTAGALAFATAFLAAKYGSTFSMAVLTADHVIGDVLTALQR
jgi:mannose-1-phosphate guanylyltransferase